MSTVDLVVESEIEPTMRVRQLGSMFDCPVEEKQRITYSFEFPYESEPWNVGLIVGPSGSGKSTVLRSEFGDMPELEWSARSVIDDFSETHSIAEVAASCQAVGFNTIPAWMRPFGVLSNGEKFRVDVARRVLELPGPVVLDEFTSVVDRQVAKIGSHAIQKYVRREGKQLVAATCHYDVIDWLQPDWVLDMATCQLTRRSLQRRPAIECTAGRVPHSAWSIFAPFHYMSARLHRAARCYGVWVGDQLVAFTGVLPRPHAVTKNIRAISRVVVLPDWQGCGLGMVLMELVGAACRGTGYRLRTYPAHPSFCRSFDRSKNWVMCKEPGNMSPRGNLAFGGRFGGVFEYVGEALSERESQRFLAC